MDWMIGRVCLVGTALLFYLVRPRERDSLLLCGLCAVAGVLSPMLPAVTPFLQWVSILTKILLLGCCAYQLRQEVRNRKVTARRAEFRVIQAGQKDFPPAV